VYYCKCHRQKFAGKFRANTMLKKYEGEVVVEVPGTYVQNEKYVQKY